MLHISLHLSLWLSVLLCELNIPCLSVASDVVTIEAKLAKPGLPVCLCIFPKLPAFPPSPYYLPRQKWVIVQLS